MNFLIAMIIIIVLVALIAATLTQRNNAEYKRREYQDECARQELIQKQDEDNNLDKE